jgi:hypothetical protein
MDICLPGVYTHLVNHELLVEHLEYLATLQITHLESSLRALCTNVRVISAIRKNASERAQRWIRMRST